MDFKVRGFEFKSKQVQKKKKIGGGGGARSRDRVRGSIWLGIGIGGVNRVRNWDRVRGGGERVTLFEKHSFQAPKEVEKSPS